MEIDYRMQQICAPLRKLASFGVKLDIEVRKLNTAQYTQLEFE